MLGWGGRGDTVSTRSLPPGGGSHGQQGQGRLEELEDRGEQVAEGETPGEEGEGRPGFLLGRLRRQVAGIATRSAWPPSGRRTMNPTKAYLVPVVVEQTSRGERSFDIYSRALEEGLGFP